jgi:hypothetical protein
MKIAINGNIIDTKDIYKISEITKDDIFHIHFKFTIYLFNAKKIDCKIYSNTYFDGAGYASLKETINFTEKNIRKIGKLQDCINSNQYKEALKKITNFRNSIVKVWSENQSDIPQFNL